MKRMITLIMLLLVILALASTAGADTAGDPDPIYVVMEPGDTVVFICPFTPIKVARYDATSGWAWCDSDSSR